MAKQSGIHQLRGKVGNYSYYKQAGVTDGLMRRIPAGLSSAVKNDENYANTRLNNAEFGSANRIAALAYNSVPARTSAMFRRFALALMTKKLLEDVKNGVGSWGQRIPAGTFDTLVTEALEAHAKAGRYDGQFGLISSIEASLSAIDFNWDIDAQTVDGLLALGVDGLTIVPMWGAAAETLQDGFYRLYGGHAYGTPVQVPFTPGESTDHAFSATPSPTLFGMSQMGFVAATELSNFGAWCVLSFLPYRRVSNQQHTLRELATYVAIPLGNLPED